MRALLTLIFILCSLLGHAQYWQTSFELGDTTYPYQFFVDTANYPGNKWQIGQPQKIVFNSAYAGSRAMMTDTLNNYPPTDTSVFYIKLPIWGVDQWYGVLHQLEFRYQLNIDSGDIANLDISRDQGQNWINIFNDSVFNINSPLDLDSSTNGWMLFSCTGFPNYLNSSDSVFLRFTYISDSSNSSRDGWILDNFFFHYYYESVNDVLPMTL